jgi:hypothetical protein
MPVTRDQRACHDAVTPHYHSQAQADLSVLSGERPGLRTEVLDILAAAMDPGNATPPGTTSDKNELGPAVFS